MSFSLHAPSFFDGKVEDWSVVGYHYETLPLAEKMAAAWEKRLRTDVYVFEDHPVPVAARHDAHVQAWLLNAVDLFDDIHF